MNIITNADVKKFLTLLQIGLESGRQKELKSYSAATNYDRISAVKDYYVHLEFSFKVDREIIENAFVEEDFDTTSQINDLLKGV